MGKNTTKRIYYLKVNILMRENGWIWKRIFPECKLLYEGEYLCGKKNGKGKYFSIIGNVSYDDEFLNGLKHGMAKEYSIFETVEYKGEFIYGQRTGNGKNFDIFDGLILINGYLCW